MQDTVKQKEEKSQPPLKFQETFDLFSSDATSYYTPQSKHVYRAFIKPDPSELDILPPRRKKMAFMGQEYELEITPEDVEEMTIIEQRKEIEHDGISVFNKEEQVIAKAKSKYKSLIKRMTKDEADDFMKTQYGTYIGAFNIEEKHGLMSSKFHNGHGNLFLYEGVTIEQIIDPNYEIKPFKYDE